MEELARLYKLLFRTNNPEEIATLTIFNRKKKAEENFFGFSVLAYLWRLAYCYLTILNCHFNKVTYLEIKLCEVMAAEINNRMFLVWFPMKAITDLESTLGLWCSCHTLCSCRLQFGSLFHFLYSFPFHIEDVISGLLCQTACIDDTAFIILEFT